MVQSWPEHDDDEYHASGASGTGAGTAMTTAVPARKATERDEKCIAVVFYLAGWLDDPLSLSISLSSVSQIFFF